MVTIILYKRMVNQTSFINIIILLLQTLLTQSSHQLSKTTKIRFSSLMVLLIWILCSQVLSLSFTSLLLRAYNTKSPSLTVETLEDIVSKPKLSIVGSRSVNEIKLYKPDIYESLISRVNQFEYKLGINEKANARNLNNQSIIKDIVERKAVMIVATTIAQMIPNLNFKADLKASDTKYNSVIRYSYVSKGLPHHHRIISA